MSSFRILEKPQGFIVEVLVLKWSLFGLKKQWEPFIKTSGMDCAWHHSTYEFAKMNLLKEIKWNTTTNSY